MPNNDPIYIGLEKAGERIVEKMIDMLFQNHSVKTGNLARSLSYEVTEQNDSYTLSLIDDSGKILKSKFDYGQAVDSGHKTRLGTSKNPNYRPRPMHTKAFTTAKPFILPSVEFVVNEYLPDELLDRTEELLNKKLDNIAKK